MFNRNIPLKEKWWIIIPLIYILSPADLIPAPILGFSIIDDAVMLMYLLSVVNSKTKKYYGDNNTDKNDKNRTKANKHKEDIIENVQYEINNDEDGQ